MSTGIAMSTQSNIADGESSGRKSKSLSLGGGWKNQTYDQYTMDEPRLAFKADDEEDDTFESDSEFDGKLMEEAPTTITTYSSRTTFRSSNFSSNGSRCASTRGSNSIKRISKGSFSGQYRNSFESMEKGRNSFGFFPGNDTSLSFKDGTVVVAGTASIRRSRKPTIESEDHELPQAPWNESFDGNSSLKDSNTQPVPVKADSNVKGQISKEDEILHDEVKTISPVKRFGAPWCSHAAKDKHVHDKVAESDQKVELPCLPPPMERSRAESFSTSSSTSSSNPHKFRSRKYSNGNTDAS